MLYESPFTDLVLGTCLARLLPYQDTLLLVISHQENVFLSYVECPRGAIVPPVSSSASPWFRCFRGIRVLSVVIASGRVQGAPGTTDSRQSTSNSAQGCSRAVSKVGKDIWPSLSDSTGEHSSPCSQFGSGSENHLQPELTCDKLKAGVLYVPQGKFWPWKYPSAILMLPLDHF